MLCAMSFCRQPPHDTAIPTTPQAIAITRIAPPVHKDGSAGRKRTRGNVSPMDRACSTAVLREALAGSDAALDRLYEHYGPRLLSFIRLKMGRSLRARLESGDILQATFLKSFQHLEEFDGDTGRSMLGWLMRIAEHEIRDRVDFHHRQRRDAQQEED